MLKILAWLLNEWENTLVNKHRAFCLGAEEQDWPHGHRNRAFAHGPSSLPLGRILHLVLCSAVVFLKSLVIPEQGTSHFHFHWTLQIMCLVLVRRGRIEGILWSGRQPLLNLTHCWLLLPGRDWWQRWLCAVAWLDFSKGTWISGFLWGIPYFKILT